MKRLTIKIESTLTTIVPTEKEETEVLEKDPSIAALTQSSQDEEFVEESP
jgi:hypothetical protein